MVKVAVITRTKDRPIFLRRAIQSVAAQTFNDYAHVILNDGGDKQAVEQLVHEQPENVQDNIKLFHRAEPSNAPDSIFNEAIDKVQSEYIAIHDDDDSWHPEFLERTLAVLDIGAKGVVVRTDNVFEDIEGTNIVQKKTTPYMSDLRAISLYRQCLDNQLTAVAFIYRRDAYEAVGKYDDSLPVVGDWEFGVRFLLSYDVEYLDPGFALAHYHRRTSADNSFALHDHRTNITKVFNRYLRQELHSGKLGIGYIMNDLRYEQDMIAATAKRLLPNPILKVLKKRTNR
jgi:glycosyltransferase involved in cell wall biosynthesis